MTFYGEMIFSGEVDYERLKAAWNQALSRHPLLTANIAGSAAAPCWVSGQSSPDQIKQQTRVTPVESFIGSPINLRTDPGARLLVNSGGNETRFLFQFHHACCDGNGAMRFIADLLAAYASNDNSAGSATGFPPLDLQLLQRRGDFRAGAPCRQHWPGRLIAKAREAYGFHTCRPQLLVSSTTVAAQSAEDAIFRGFESRLLTLEQSLAIADSAGRLGVSVNDVALALAFQTIAQWNDRRTDDSSDAFLRIVVPTDLRDRSDIRLSAANRMSLYFLARRPSDCRNLDQLLTGIHQEMSYVKRCRVGLDLLHALRALHGFPAAVRGYLRLRRSVATAIVTNLSDPSRHAHRRMPRDAGRLVVGNMVLERIGAVPPLRPGTRIGIAVGCYADRISLSARCDPRWFTSEDTSRFLDDYVDSWLRWSKQQHRQSTVESLQEQ